MNRRTLLKSVAALFAGRFFRKSKPLGLPWKTVGDSRIRDAHQYAAWSTMRAEQAVALNEIRDAIFQ